MDFKIKVPESHKAKVMLWIDVSYGDMEEIDKMQSIPDLESALCRVLKFDLPEPKRGVLLEVFVQTVLFCREHNFNKEQTSALLSTIKSIHEANIETPLNNMKQCFSYCKELLLCHSVRRPPFSINLFNSEEVNCISEYIFNSYMRHSRVYKCVFTPQVRLNVSLTYSGIQDHDDSIVSAENVMEEEAQLLPNNEESPETQETSITDQEENTFDSTLQEETQLEKVDREQMIPVSGQVDEQMTEAADQNNSTLSYSQ